MSLPLPGDWEFTVKTYSKNSSHEMNLIAKPTDCRTLPHPQRALITTRRLSFAVASRNAVTITTYGHIHQSEESFNR
jgi:hypothetical protein